MSDPAAIPKAESPDPAMTGRDRRPSSCSVEWHKCVAGTSHQWGKWSVTNKWICRTWGTLSITRERSCSVCGLTEATRNTV